MASDIEKTVSELMKDKMYALQADESTDIGEMGSAHEGLLHTEVRWLSRDKVLSRVHELKQVNTSMQGKNENMLTSSDKIKGSLEKIRLWKDRVSDGNADMFQKTAEAKYTDIIPLIKEHLEILEWNIEKYFPNISADQYDWFSTSYLCELGFSTLTNIKTKKRSRLLSVEEEMRVCLSSVPPNIERICKSRQLQVSH
ncbi:zinc finger BED domain-containing protein 5-like [Macrobrachium rosenbergii]|uniref:zinc finger BED domain-containing protein 5-like n=1 Tax=Macrobrachium rosenbergii TaxID=79674 RepID=UPI0034D6B742